MNGTPEREIRLKRLRIRCWRRGTREMDLILGGFADKGVHALDDGELDALEGLLDENDNDLYTWVAGTRPVPEIHASIIGRLRRFHGITDV